MKKSIFIFAALFAATFANAQITLEHTFNGDLYPWTFTLSGFPQAQYVYGDLFFSAQKANDNYLITIYDANDFEVITSFICDNSLRFIAARGYFSTSNEVMVLLPQNNHLVLYSESGELVQELGDITISKTGLYPQIIRMSDGTCKLYILSGGDDWNLETQTQDPFVTRIYSLPGNGEAQAVSTPAPKKNARKIAREGQVLVETDTNTFDLRGQEVK
jgi:hypothetical protein